MQAVQWFLSGCAKQIHVLILESVFIFQRFSHLFYIHRKRAIYIMVKVFFIKSMNGCDGYFE